MASFSVAPLFAALIFLIASATSWGAKLLLRLPCGRSKLEPSDGPRDVRGVRGVPGADPSGAIVDNGSGGIDSPAISPLFF